MAVITNQKKLDLTLTVDTNAYAANDVLADTQELTEAVEYNHGGYIEFIRLLDPDDQGAALDLVFLRSNTSLGTENNALNISDGDAEAIECVVPIAAADYVDLINSQMAQKVAGDQGMGYIIPNGGTSIYVGAIARGTATYAGGELELRITIARD